MGVRGTLTIGLSTGVLPWRIALRKPLTTVGSSSNADIRLPAVPGEWLLIRENAGSVVLDELVSGRSHPLRAGEPVRVADYTIAYAIEEVAAPLDWQVLSDALGVGVSMTPKDALAALLRACVGLMKADKAAVLMLEQGQYSVVASIDVESGRQLSTDELLSDTIVRDALESKQHVVIDDASKHPRYQNVPSVYAFRLHAVACVPLRHAERVVGLLYLGRQRLSVPFASAELRELEVASSLVQPWLSALRALHAPDVASKRATRLSALRGDSAPMCALRETIARVGSRDISVLVRGPTGSGKELVAQAIHEQSERAGGPLVAFNCSAVTETLFASELFGVKKGAFTGAMADRKGVIESAHRGTLFLDEVADLPLALQPALLRVLETKDFLRVGDSQSRTSDFRLIAATHKDLEREVQAGRFRQDLLYRLREFEILVPPLAARGADIGALAALFLAAACTEFGLRDLRFSADAVDSLMAYSWPGNVRELRAAIRSAALRAEREVTTKDLGLALPSSENAVNEEALGQPLEVVRERHARQYVMRTLQAHDGNREATALALGVSLRTVYRYLSETK